MIHLVETQTLHLVETLKLCREESQTLHLVETQTLQQGTLPLALAPSSFQDTRNIISYTLYSGVWSSSLWVRETLGLILQPPTVCSNLSAGKGTLKFTTTSFSASLVLTCTAGTNITLMYTRKKTQWASVIIYTCTNSPPLPPPNPFPYYLAWPQYIIHTGIGWGCCWN